MIDYAKIGYEAYREASGGTTFDGRPMPTWEELGQLPHGARTRRLWGEAAAAMISNFVRHPAATIQIEVPGSGRESALMVHSEMNEEQWEDTLNKLDAVVKSAHAAAKGAPRG